MRLARFERFGAVTVGQERAERGGAEGLVTRVEEPAAAPEPAKTKNAAAAGKAAPAAKKPAAKKAAPKAAAKKKSK